MSQMSNKSENALNAICPYFTMFPLEYPTRVLKKYKSSNPIVVDPFCGRGTTLYAARKLGLDAWGLDSSPVAVAIAKAKLASCNPDEVIKLAQKIIIETTPSNIPSSEFFKWAYHEDTLKQLCALRKGLLNRNRDSNASAVLRAAALGCLHGPLNKREGIPSYFSNQMPRTFSSKPNYSVRYWKERKLKPKPANIVDVLEKKVRRLQGLSNEYVGNHNQIIFGDSRKPITMTRVSDNFSMVITSPPYYGMRTYVQDHWLRNWFLGGPDDVDYIVRNQLDHNGQENFAESLGDVWTNMASSNANELRMFVRFGIIPSAKVDTKSIFLSSLESSGERWRLISTRSAKTAQEGKRQARQMNSKSQAAVEFDFHVLRQ
ncbi:DNA methyltransferase [uncultured Microbulbifer sp.]|uniref:DNA methyltransferase n=1 Tax=uncultured Microbulbifer sp. TaxID=348147 RepID=UPI00260968C1|nr:DNA methyltransferase [uncultured Microbulbifer sp.]